MTAQENGRVMPDVSGCSSTGSVNAAAMKRHGIEFEDLIYVVQAAKLGITPLTSQPYLTGTPG